MSCNITEDQLRIIMKYSTIAGQQPTIPLTADHEDGTWLPTDLYVGELFFNTADGKAWFRAEDGIVPIVGTAGGTFSFIGDYVHITGGTYSGPVFAPTFSANGITASYIIANTYQGGTFNGAFVGDGSGLTGINANWLGGNVPNPSDFLNQLTLSGPTYVDGPVYTNNSYIDIRDNIYLSGGKGISASFFIGDGSGLTNIPAGTYSNTYTIGGSASGYDIVYTLNDASTYTVNIESMFGTGSNITNAVWNDLTSELTFIFGDGTQIVTPISTFNSLAVYGAINADEVYANNFYGTFNGTYSNDIYTTSATLIGTEAIFDRTDGVTYSLDLSSFSGGGIAGPTGATGPQGDRAVMNLSYTGSSLTLGTGTITLPINPLNPIKNLGWQQGTRVRVWHSATEYMEGQITSVITNPQTTGIDVNIDYVLGSGSFGQWYVGIAGDIGASGTAGATPSLAEVLAIGNTTGTNNIILSIDSAITNESGTNGYTFVENGDYFPKIYTNAGTNANFIIVEDSETLLRNEQINPGFTDRYGQTIMSSTQILNTVEDNISGEVAQTTLTSNQVGTTVTTTANPNFTETTQGQTNIQNRVDSGYAATGSSTFDIFYNETVAKTDCIIDGGIGTLSSGQRTYQDGIGAIGSEITTSNTTQGFYANIYNWFDPTNFRVENIFSITAANPYGSSYTTNITQRKDEIIVEGSGGFRGIEYAADYSNDFTANSLVTKDWVINNQATSLTDTVCNRTDEIFVDASGGEYECNPYIYPTPSYTTIRSAMSGETASITLSPSSIDLYVGNNTGSYESNISISQEILKMYGGRPDADNQTEWGLALGTEYRSYRYVDPVAPWGDPDKFEEKRLVLHQKFTNDSGTPGQLDLYYENFVQDAINDFEIDFYIMNSEVQVSNKKYMTKSYKRRVYYNTSNQATILIPDETKQGDTLDPAYNSWSITTQSGIYGTKYVLDYTLDGSYDYSVTIVVRQTAKKY